MEKKQVDPAGFTGITELRDDFYDCVEQRKKFLEKKKSYFRWIESFWIGELNWLLNDVDTLRGINAESGLFSGSYTRRVAFYSRCFSTRFN